MNRFVTLSAVLASIILTSPTAQAADLDPNLGGGRTFVEYGSGWYLRGHIGYSAVHSGNLTFFSDDRYSYDDQSFGHNYSAGFGFGHTFNKHFRMDFTVDYHGERDWSGDTTGTSCGTPGDTGSCFSEDEAQLELTNFSINGYYSLGAWQGFAPYVGAGIGLADVKWASYSSQAICILDPGETCAGYGTHSGGAGAETFNGAQTGYSATSGTALTYSLMAGLEYRLDKNWLLDLEYKYTHVSDGVVLLADDNNLNGNSEFDAFGLHDIRFGVRYEIW